jgi:hypothetical protein
MFGKQLQQTFTALVIYHFCLLLFETTTVAASVLALGPIRCVTLLTGKTKHLKNVRQSLCNQLFDCFHIHLEYRSGFNHRDDYLVLGHHVDCFRIDTYRHLISTDYSCRVWQKEHLTTEISNESNPAASTDQFFVGRQRCSGHERA